MSYEKQIWETGDTITAEKLNHIEDGLKDTDDKIPSPRGDRAYYFLNVNNTGPEWINEDEIANMETEEGDGPYRPIDNYVLILNQNGGLEKIDIQSLKFLMVGDS